MGLVFVLGQGNEFLNEVHLGNTISATEYGSVFFLTEGFHGLHVIGGLVAFILFLARTTLGRFTPGPGDGRDRRVLLLALRRRCLDRALLDHLSHPLTASPKGRS